MKEYYYFSNAHKKLGFGDGREIELGITHKVDCEPILCQQGLHASARPLDALQYAHSPIIWKVTLSGTVVHGEDKSVATERTYVRGGVDVSDTLRAFARKCALDVVHLWDAPKVVIDYLKTGDEALRDSVKALVQASILDSPAALARAAARVSTSSSPAALARAVARAVARVSARNSASALARNSTSASALARASRCALARASTSVSGDILDYINKSQNRRLAQMISKAIKEN